MSVDHLVDVLGGARQDVGAGHPQRVGVGQEPLEVAIGELADGDAGGRRAADDLVVDVGDVHHPADREARASAGDGRSRSANRNDRKLPMCAGP